MWTFVGENLSFSKIGLRVMFHSGIEQVSGYEAFLHSFFFFSCLNCIKSFALSRWLHMDVIGDCIHLYLPSTQFRLKRVYLMIIFITWGMNSYVLYANKRALEFVCFNKFKKRKVNI